LPLVDGVGPVTGRPGRPRRRAERLLADRGYDHDKYRRELWARGVKPVIARRSTVHGSGLGKERWVVERTFGGVSVWFEASRTTTRSGGPTDHEDESDPNPASYGSSCDLSEAPSTDGADQPERDRYRGPDD
jgi:transposase